MRPSTRTTRIGIRHLFIVASALALITAAAGCQKPEPPPEPHPTIDISATIQEYIDAQNTELKQAADTEPALETPVPPTEQPPAPHPERITPAVSSEAACLSQLFNATASTDFDVPAGVPGQDLRISHFVQRENIATVAASICYRAASSVPFTSEQHALCLAVNIRETLARSPNADPNLIGIHALHLCSPIPTSP